MNFETHFSEDRVIRRLCHFRISNAESRHAQHYLRNISNLAPAPDEPGSFDRMFPSRNEWLRPSKRERQDRGRDAVSELALYRAVTAKKASAIARGEGWAQELQAYVSNIRSLAFSEAMDIAPPVIHLSKKTSGRYRALAAYPIAERVVLGLTTQYLGRRLDDQLVNNVFGQRMGYSTRTWSHHDAVNSLIAFRTQHLGRRLWVAEIDLRCFFDCVSHDAVREALDRAVERSRGRGMHVDPQALVVINGFLRSYSLSGTAWPGAQRWLQAHDKSGTLDLPELELDRLWGKTWPTLGLPQGGAPSGLLANLVLASVDRAVLNDSTGGDSDLFYARYLDDIIIAHPDARACNEAQQRLLAAIEVLRLPVHPPGRLSSYGRRSTSTGKNLFWNYKSKAPYRWERGDISRLSVPWVGFLGYQVRFDGHLRIRPSSVARQMSEQVLEVDRVLSLVRRHAVDTPRSEFARKALVGVVGRLSAMVGAVGGSGKVTHGWASGFRLLRRHSYTPAQIKRLDQGRSRQIHRLVRRLRTIGGAAFPGSLLTRLSRYSTSYLRAFASEEEANELENIERVDEGEVDEQDLC